MNFIPDQVWLFIFLVSIFAILMLPFASIFLSTKLRAKFGNKKVVLSLLVLLVAVPIVLAMTIPPLLKSPYLRFMDKDKKYFSDVAQACDLILQQHPVSANDSALFYKRAIPYTIKLSGHDASLPKIIKALHPDMIFVSTNRVVIEIPPERMGGFGIIWGPDDTRTNYWSLQSDGDGLVTTVYEKYKL